MKDKDKHDTLNSFDTGMGTQMLGKDEDTEKLTDGIFNMAKGQKNENQTENQNEKKDNKKTYFSGEGKKLGVTDVKVIDNDEKKDNIKPIYKKEEKKKKKLKNFLLHFIKMEY